MKFLSLLTFLTFLFPTIGLAEGGEDTVTWRYERITQVFINGTNAFG